MWWLLGQLGWSIATAFWVQKAKRLCVSSCMLLEFQALANQKVLTDKTEFAAGKLFGQIRCPSIVLASQQQLGAMEGGLQAVGDLITLQTVQNPIQIGLSFLFNFPYVRRCAGMVNLRFSLSAPKRREVSLAWSLFLLLMDNLLAYQQGSQKNARQRHFPNS